MKENVQHIKSPLLKQFTFDSQTNCFTIVGFVYKSYLLNDETSQNKFGESINIITPNQSLLNIHVESKGKSELETFFELNRVNTVSDPNQKFKPTIEEHHLSDLNLEVNRECDMTKKLDTSNLKFFEFKCRGKRLKREVTNLNTIGITTYIAENFEISKRTRVNKNTNFNTFNISEYSELATVNGRQTEVTIKGARVDLVLCSFQKINALDKDFFFVLRDITILETLKGSDCPFVGGSNIPFTDEEFRMISDKICSNSIVVPF